MISWLISLYKKKHPNAGSQSLRYAVGRICGWAGIFLNFLLFASKYAIGVLVSSVAIKGDAINNLTDALNNVVSIISFHMSEKPADKEHPYGHERTETITALFMGLVIIYLGFEMLKESIGKFMNPGPVDFQWSAAAVLAISIAVKLLMYAYNNKYGKEYDSDLLKANALDSRNDVFGTLLILISTFVSPLIHYNLDGIMGIIVSFIIFKSAYDLLKDVINRLIGEAPLPETLNEVTDILLCDPMVLDVHDVILHSYGPKKTYATAHVEVDSNQDLLTVHNHVDKLERVILKRMDIDLVIHVDPIRLHDPETIEAEELFSNLLEKINPEWTMHDFRIEISPIGPDEIYFDLVVPYTESRNEEELSSEIRNHMQDPDKYALIIRVEHPYS